MRHIKKFNEGTHLDDETGLKYLTDGEFQKRREDIINQLKVLIENYNEFTKMISPEHWRSSGHIYTELKKIESQIVKWKKISKEQLDNKWVRKSLGLDEDED